MYLNDTIDHVSACFAGNENTADRPATLKVTSIDSMPLFLDYAMLGYRAQRVRAHCIRPSTLFERQYLVFEFPNGEVETYEFPAGDRVHTLRAFADGLAKTHHAAQQRDDQIGMEQARQR